MKQILIKALQESGKLVMNQFGKIQPFQVKEYNASIVTEVDLASENLIISIITSDFPEHNIVAEETGFRDHNSSYTWIIDPIDGTSNFAVGLPWFGILICLMKDFDPILSGVYLPFYNKMYVAEKNKGAVCNEKKIKCSLEKELRNVLIAYSLDFSNNDKKLDQEMKFMREFVKHSRNLRATNSVLDMCYTAEGRLGASINQTCKIWDIAAPYLIAQESGAIVTDFFNRPLDFHFDSSTYLKNFDYLIANTHIHRRLNEIIYDVNSL
jgi:myo-inositol-1(or 4)-monophosphatase